MKFAYKNNAWSELLVDLKDEYEDEARFKFCYSQPNSENVTKFLEPEKTFEGMEFHEDDEYEFSPDLLKYTLNISYLLSTSPMASALIIDYGDMQAFSNSFRGIKDQRILKKEEILDNSGECDLTSYVNFRAIKNVLGKFSNLKFGGIMQQGDFLECLGIENRANDLKKNLNLNKSEIIDRQYHRLVDPDKMGDTYKVFYIHKNTNKPVYPFIEEILDYIKNK